MVEDDSLDWSVRRTGDALSVAFLWKKTTNPAFDADMEDAQGAKSRYGHV